MNRLIGLGLRRGWRQGVLEGNRAWLLVGGLALTMRVIQRMAGKEEKVVYSEQLRPGETLVITHDRTISG
jgi:hypothetical protein